MQFAKCMGSCLENGICDESLLRGMYQRAEEESNADHDAVLPSDFKLIWRVGRAVLGNLREPEPEEQHCSASGLS